MSYGQIITEYRHYDEISNRIMTPTHAILKFVNEAPPSYSSVLAEKYEQEQWLFNHDRNLKEMNNLILFMKKTLKDTEIISTSYQYCCQRLEYKNQYLLNLIEKEQHNSSSTISVDSLLDQSDINDSLTRMNDALNHLIQEAKTSLNTRYSTLKKSQSCPLFHSKESQLVLKKRYLHSQWKLTIAMKQFIDTVHNSHTPFNNTTTIHHHHHHHYHHHHHHHHHYHSSPSLIKKEESNNISILNTFIKYAVDTVSDLIQHNTEESVKKTVQSSTVKYRMMFLCTIVISHHFKRNKWIKRSQILSTCWKQKKHLYHLWLSKSKLLFYVIQFY